MEHRLCIIGGGPRATYVLQYMLAAWRSRPLQGRLRISIIEPVEFGAGTVYQTAQPDFLRLNTIASQVTAYPDETVVSPLPRPKGPTLYEWCRTPHNGLAADAYPSRRETGRYLAAVFGHLLGDAPASVTIECHRTAAVDMRRTREGEWSVHLGDGQELRCDAAVLAVGCAGSAQTDTANLASAFGVPRSSAEERLIAIPYPIERTLARLHPRETVGILGLGLTALDIIRACTIGRGGKFLREDGRLRYVPCGDEPHLVAWSRTGLPLMARAVNQKPINQKVRARYLTEETVDKLRRGRQHVLGTPKLDFVDDLLPLLVQEMADAYDAALAPRLEGATLPRCRRHENQAAAVRQLDRKVFPWERLVCPLTSGALRTADQFRFFFLDYLRRDVAESLQGNLSSPVKSACDVIRDLRDKLRYAVEFGGLTPDSHRFFDTEFTPLHNRLAVGPPVEAIEELLALVEAGIVDPFCGPAPHVRWDPCNGRLVVRPSAFRGPSREVSVVVNARISPTDVATTASPLVRNLLAGGQIVPYANALNGTVYRPGGIAVTDSYRVIDKHAHAHDNLFAIGALTEGCTWYSQVLARPYVNSRSMRDAASVALSLWDYLADRATVHADSACARTRKPHDMKQTPVAELETRGASAALTLSRSCVP
jgi:uncharacterized NAD(P)/FAD-binding protein YdhS